MKRAAKQGPNYSIRLDQGLRAELERLAQQENRALANMIETLLREALAIRRRRSDPMLDENEKTALGSKSRK